MLIALTRAVSPSLGDCELTHLARCRIDVARARAQHTRYEKCLVRLGCRLRRLPEAPNLPDAVFVEDTCIVLDEVAVITRPGVTSRRPETSSVAAALAEYRELRLIEEPGTLDGGDVLVHGRTVYVGLSTRTNQEAIRQLDGLLAPLGYRVTTLEVRGCLHLKSAVTLVAPGVVLINPAWVDAAAFTDLAVIEVDPTEPFAGNALAVGGVVLYPDGFPRTRERLERSGLDVLPVDVSELGKAEGGVTCCCVLVA
jgi:dimethylargininase